MSALKVFLSAIALSGYVLTVSSSAAGNECSCNGDLTGDGNINLQDAFVLWDCLEGDCSGCVNSCDINCSGDTDDMDWEALRCLKADPGAAECCSCSCNADVDCDGALTDGDVLIVQDCVDGDCSGCVDSCDIDCDGAVDGRDMCGAACLLAGYSSDICCGCTCGGDADGDGALTYVDCHMVERCVFGDCSWCAGAGCDLNCDGAVDGGDVDACWCLLEGGPEAECCWGWTPDPPDLPKPLPLPHLGPEYKVPRIRALDPR